VALIRFFNAARAQKSCCPKGLRGIEASAALAFAASASSTVGKSRLAEAAPMALQTARFVTF
jgi:hypothetical protein